MIPIFISEARSISLMFEILGIKLVLGVFWGLVIDFIFRKFIMKKHSSSDKTASLGNQTDLSRSQKALSTQFEEIENNNGNNENIEEMCEDEHCHCHEQGILRASITHTLNITVYIFIITLIINLIIGLIGEETIETFIKNNLFLGPIISSLIGLIPNCAASVIITNLYIENVINMASLISGLLTGAGVGLLVLFRTNKKHIKENLCIIGIMYFIGVVSGLILQLIL